MMEESWEKYCNLLRTTRSIGYGNGLASQNDAGALLSIDTGDVEADEDEDEFEGIDEPL